MSYQIFSLILYIMFSFTLTTLQIGWQFFVVVGINRLMLNTDTYGYILYSSETQNLLSSRLKRTANVSLH